MMMKKVLPISVAILALTGLIILLALGLSQKQDLVQPGPEEETSESTKPFTTLQLHIVENAVEREAVCNDGSPAVYYHRPGTAEGTDKWLLYLQGGGGCDSLAGCEERLQEDPRLTSSNNAAKQLTQKGIFSIDSSINPDFYNWNHVYFKYCSSDSWSGDDEVQGENMLWQFRGHEIIGAVIEDLQEQELFGEQNLGAATEVLFAGSSAGGGGTQQNLDRVAEMLPWAQVKGIIDSAYTFEIEPFGGEYVDFYGHPMDRETAVAFIENRGDESCEAVYGADSVECRVTETLLPYLETPVFFYIDQRDKVKIANLSIDDLKDPAQLDYMKNTFYPRQIASFELLNDSIGLFSPRVGFHVSLTNDRFNSVKIDEHSFQEILGNWYFDREGPTQVVE